MWGWNWNVYNQTKSEIQAGAQEAAGSWVRTIPVPAKGSAPVQMTGGYCLAYLYIYTPNCRMQQGNKFAYWINCLGGGLVDRPDYGTGTTCCWNVDVTVEQVGENGTDGFPICRVRTGKP